MSATRITNVVITPVAFRDPPLLNAVGVHEPFAIRSIIEVETSSGITGLGESYGDLGHLERLRIVGEALRGINVFATNRMLATTAGVLSGAVGADRHGLTGSINATGTVLRVFSAFEVAALDIQGKILGQPVADLLGGAIRDSVPFSAYLFYKWPAHPGETPDEFGEALTPDDIVRQARWMLDTYGFRAIKLKGGVFPPDEEMAAIFALRDAFPEVPLRLDPNTAWSIPTSIRVGQTLDGVLEYLEDPTPGISGMAAVAREVPMPLATNMCVVGFDDIPPALIEGAVGVILSDHHYWGGLEKVRQLATICETFDLGLSMHSNSHLGISLAAMTHVAAAVPNLTYALDTHWPWKCEDVIESGVLSFVDGAIAVPTAPGLGIELDRDALARLHEQYLKCAIAERNDTTYMQTFDPSYDATLPRW
ncbi:MAG TPA: glucarate dehydratase family protein [Acidimicrobiales bacterium]|jgi:glucarate dehydratase|nr:glucarate dehydratase family protein [Acidimicrobiales bacterium]